MLMNNETVLFKMQKRKEKNAQQKLGNQQVANLDQLYLILFWGKELIADSN